MKLREKPEETNRARWGFIGFLAVLSLFLWNDARAEFRTYSPCETCFKWFDSRARVWPGNVDIYINMENSPFPQSVVEDALRLNLEAIQKRILIPLSYSGFTNEGLVDDYTASHEGSVIIHWESVELLGSAEIWWDWSGKGKINHGQILLDPGMPLKCLDGILLHELLHILYIGHSESQESIMYSTPYNSCSYQETLRRDDIEALTALYPSAGNYEPVVTGECLNGYTVYVPRIRHEGMDLGFEFCLTPDKVLSVWEGK